MIVNRDGKGFFGRVLAYAEKIQIVIDFFGRRDIPGKLGGKFMIFFRENFPAHFNTFIADKDISGAGN